MYNMFNNIDGHQYYLDEWGSGKIIINDSINATQARIQFNMVSGKPITGESSSEEKGFILRDKSITCFIINDSKFVRIPPNMFLKGVERNYFAQPIYSNNNYFLIDYSKILKEPYMLNNGYNKVALNKKYIPSKKFYILNKDDKYVSIKLKKKAIL